MYPLAPHDPALAYQLLLQQQPAPQYMPPPAFPFALHAGAQQPQLVPPQYMLPPPAPLAPQYMPPPPAFQSSSSPPGSPRRPRQPRQQQSEPDSNEFASRSIAVLLALLIGAAFGAVGEHHRLSSAVEAGVVR